MVPEPIKDKKKDDVLLTYLKGRSEGDWLMIANQ
jgi:hypothetical protein